MGDLQHQWKKSSSYKKIGLYKFKQLFIYLFFHKLRTNIKLDTRQFSTLVFTRTCEINFGRGNATQKPKRQNPLPYRWARTLLHCWLYSYIANCLLYQKWKTFVSITRCRIYDFRNIPSNISELTYYWEKIVGTWSCS